MNRIARLLLLVVLLFGGMVGGASVSAQGDGGYDEYVVTLENDIVATVVEPAADGPVPAVLMLHGFGSFRDEVGNMYQRLAAELGQRGIASIRIDFRGWGESGGGMENSTLTGMVEDAATAYDYLLTQPFVDSAHLGVLGFSLGGRVAIVTAAEHPDGYQSMALWSTGGNISPDFLGQEALDTAQAEGQVTVDLGFREVTLGADFFESMTAYDVEEEFVKYANAFLVIAGTEDESHDYLNWYLENAQGELRAAYGVEGADHIYGVLGDDQTYADSVITTTADWFVMTLK